MPDPQQDKPATVAGCIVAIILLILAVCIIASIIGYFTCEPSKKQGFLTAALICSAAPFVLVAVFKKDKK